MIWNTIMPSKMMDPASGGGNGPSAFENVVFSKEALESPIKHMNRDLLATFDYIIWINQTSNDVPAANSFSKNTLLVGDFESLFAAGKNKTIVNGLVISSELGIRQNPDTGAAEYYPIEHAGMNYYIEQFPLIMPKSLYGKTTMGVRKLDFGKDSFVMMSAGGASAILISPSGEMLFGNDVEIELLKYVVHGSSTA